MGFPAPGSYLKDEDGFAPPSFAGPTAKKYSESVTYEDTTATLLFTIPTGAVITEWTVNVTEAFNDTGTDLLDIGDGTTADRFAANLDVSSTGQLVTGYDPDELLGTPLTEPLPVYAAYTGQNGNASAGAAKVVVEYMLR